MEIHLRLIIWANGSLSRYTIYPPPIYVVNSDSAILLFVTICYIKNVQAMVIELSIYNLQWIACALDFLGEILEPGLPLAPMIWAHIKPVPQSIMKWH